MKPEDVTATMLKNALVPPYTTGEFMAGWKQLTDQDKADLKEWYAREAKVK